MWDVKKLKGFQLQGASPPHPLTKLALVAMDPAGGSPPDPRYRLALCALAIEPQA